MAVNEKQVLAHIDHYQGRFMTVKDPIEKNRLAFRAIKDFRNQGSNSVDESLAAAEHYLFARFMVSSGTCSSTQMDVMTVGYDGVKYLAQTTDTTEKMMRHNPANPTSRVSADSVSWGLKGSEDGEADRLAYNSAKKVPNWNWDAMKFGGVTDAIAEFGKSIY